MCFRVSTHVLFLFLFFMDRFALFSGSETVLSGARFLPPGAAEQDQVPGESTTTVVAC